MQTSYAVNDGSFFDQMQQNILSNTSGYTTNYQNNLETQGGLFSQQSIPNGFQNNSNPSLNIGIQKNSPANMTFGGNAAGDDDFTTKMQKMLADRSRGTTLARFELRECLNDKGWTVSSINHMIEYDGRSLEELRAVDYRNIKTGNLPEHWKLFVIQKIEEARASENDLPNSNSISLANGNGNYQINSTAGNSLFLIVREFTPCQVIVNLAFHYSRAIAILIRIMED